MYLEDQNFEDAEIFNMLLLRQFSDDSAGHINAAIISLNNDLPSEAIKYLEPVITRFNNNYSALYLLGTSYFQNKDLSNAEKYLRLSLAVYPQSRNSKHTLAMIYDQTGFWFKCICN